MLWPERLFARIERGLMPLLALLLAFTTVGVFIQVLMRFLFAKSFLWGEELSLFAFIWCVFLGTAIISMRRTHFAFDALDGLLHGRALYLQQLVINICMLVVAYVMTVEGWYFSVVSLQRLSPALGITLFIPTIIIPVAGALMMLVNVIDIVRYCRRLWTGTQ